VSLRRIWKGALGLVAVLICFSYLVLAVTYSTTPFTYNSNLLSSSYSWEAYTLINKHTANLLSQVILWADYTGIYRYGVGVMDDTYSELVSGGEAIRADNRGVSIIEPSMYGWHNCSFSYRLPILVYLNSDYSGYLEIEVSDSDLIGNLSSGREIAVYIDDFSDQSSFMLGGFTNDSVTYYVFVDLGSGYHYIYIYYGFRGEWVEPPIEIPVSYNGSDTLTDYVVVIDGVSPSCGFMDSNGNPLYFWIDSRGKAFVKVPEIPSGGTSIYMVCDGSLSSYNDPSKVFLFFDDFSSDTIASGVWVKIDGDDAIIRNGRLEMNNTGKSSYKALTDVPNSFVIEAYGYDAVDNDDADLRIGVIDTDGYLISSLININLKLEVAKQNISSTSFIEYKFINIGSDYSRIYGYISLIREGDLWIGRWEFEGGDAYSVSYDGLSLGDIEGIVIGFNSGSADTIYYDWIYMRPYHDPEPVAIYGSNVEASQPDALSVASTQTAPDSCIQTTTNTSDFYSGGGGGFAQPPSSETPTSPGPEPIGSEDSGGFTLPLLGRVTITVPEWVVSFRSGDNVGVLALLAIGFLALLYVLMSGSGKRKRR